MINIINRYYHYICNDIEKEIYSTILDGLMNYQDKIYLQNLPSYVTSNLLGKIFKMVLYDNPKIFYTSTQGCRIGSDSRSLFLMPKYFFALDAVLELQNWLDERVEEICSPITGLTDIFAKEIYIHNYLIKNVNYSNFDVAQPVNAYTVAGTLLENNSVCAGVALSFKLLMDYLDIPCIAATGIATNNVGMTERHAWNITYIEDSYYQMDVTWDLLNGQRKRIIKYDYFNLTTQEMYKSRIPDFEYPLCINQDYNYFEYMNAVVRSSDELITFTSNQIYKGEKCIYFKYTFELLDMKHKLPRYLKLIPWLGRYNYWINETAHTVLIMRI